MNKAGIWALLLLFLTGCSGSTKEMDKGLEFRSKLLQANEVCFVAKITADYGDKVYEFSMDCQADGKGDMTFTVTAPETIAGITGCITEDGGKLTFDDIALHIELLTDDQLSPVSAPWIFLKTLRSGYLTSAGMDGEYIRLTIDDSYEDDALQLDIWINDQNLPERVEILYEGRNILSLVVSNFKIG